MKELAVITVERSRFKGNDVVLIGFAYDTKLVSLMRQIPGAWWNKQVGCWMVSEGMFQEELFRERIGPYGEIIMLDREERNGFIGRKPVPEEPKQGRALLPEGYLEKLERKRYSKSTIGTYCSYMKDFVKAFAGEDLLSISTDQINDYILKLIRMKGISPSQQNQRINAIKFYYEKVLGREKEYYDIERPKKELKLPKILSEDEVLSILRCTKNLKHKAILGTLYSSGLRKSEVINLRKQDVLFDKALIFIRGGKGKRDRTVTLSEVVSIVLKRYMETYRPNYWMFEGMNRRQYSGTSISRILDKSVRLAGIQRRVTPHMLRHSFATHMHEQGADIRYIQLILGHASSETTDIYTYVSRRTLAKVRSPLDTILKDKLGG